MEIEPVLARCPAVTIRVCFEIVTSGQRDGDDGGLVLLSGGWAGSGAVLSYTLEELWLMEAGHLDICFWWAGETQREICNRPGDFKCFLVYNWLPYCSLNTDFLLAHLFTNHFGIQTTLCKLEALSAEKHIYSLPPLASSNQSASCWQIFLRALTKTRRMSQHSHYSHKDGCCSGNITRAAAQWIC